MASLEELREFLPGTDCGRCGMGCAEFSALLLTRERAPENCAVLHEPDFTGFIEALHELLGAAPVSSYELLLDGRSMGTLLSTFSGSLRFDL